MPWFLLINDKPIAYVSKQKVLIDPNVASDIEACLMAFGLQVNMGIDEEIVREGRKVTGYPLKITRTDIEEGYLTKAIEICVALQLAFRVEKEELEKLYEVTEIKRNREDEQIEDTEGESSVELEEA